MPPWRKAVGVNGKKASRQAKSGVWRDPAAKKNGVRVKVKVTVR